MGIRLKDLSKLGYRDNVARSLVVDIVGKYCKHDTKEQIAMTLSNILEHPESYKNNEIWSKLAERLSPTVLAKEFVAYDLREDPLMYKTYGGKFIETLAKQQMNLAMRLPVTVGGALMPDAHAGYGLPIGGVLATDNAVIPYAVGVPRFLFHTSCIPEAAIGSWDTKLPETIFLSDKGGFERLYTFRNGWRPGL